MKYPSIQFYPGDWRKDAGVQALNFEERGIWVELLMIMSECEPRGKLMLGGKPISEDRLAQILRIDNTRLSQVMITLLSLNVARLCPETGAVMSKRMVEDTKILDEKRSEKGHGGNPNFKKGKKNPYYQHLMKDNQLYNSDITGGLSQKDNSKITSSSSSSSSITIPLSLQGDVFLKAWGRWVGYRKQIKHPLKPITQETQLREFETWGVQRAVAAIEFTILKGWQGLREPKNSENGQFNPPPQQTQKPPNKMTRYELDVLTGNL